MLLSYTVILATCLESSDEKDQIQKYVKHNFQSELSKLMNHQTGISEYIYDLPIEDLDKMSLEETCEHIKSKKRIDFDKFHYSNSNYTLLSLAILKSLGRDYSSFVHENLFNPIGMSNSFSFDDSQGQNYMTPLYTTDSSTSKLQKLSRATMGWGDSAFFSSTNDLSKWINSSAFIDIGKNLADKCDHTKYSSGFFLEIFKNEPVIFHTGSTLGAESLLLHMPQPNFSIIYLSNHNSSSKRGAIPRLLSIFDL